MDTPARSLSFATINALSAARTSPPQAACASSAAVSSGSVSGCGFGAPSWGIENYCVDHLPTLEQTENMSIPPAFGVDTIVPFSARRSILQLLVESSCVVIGKSLSDLILTIAGNAPRAAAIADIVFIHGLGGDGQTTWQVNGD